MNKPAAKLISIILCAILALDPISLAFGQANTLFSGPASKNPPSNRTRSGGKSFGSDNEQKESPLLMSPFSIPSKQPFQEPTYSGLIYQIHILGEVDQPGTFRVTASTRLSEAIEKGGGILEGGSERRIELRRKGGGRQKIDLLSFKLFGNLNANPYLLDNDIIFIPLREKVVEIEGPVKRPGEYELTEERTLKDVVQLAGGYTAGMSKRRPIKVIRFDHGSKEILDVENREVDLANFLVENADVVVVPHLFTETKRFDYNLGKLPGDNQLFYPSYDERVFILGAVSKPGPFPFSPYSNVSHYITLSGGTTKLAKTKEIQILTFEGETVNVSNKTEVNPGDTIFIPEKYMAPETVVTLILGLATSVLGITTMVLSLTR